MHGGLMPEDQLAERGGVAIAGSGDQVVVGHSVSRHRGRLAGWVQVRHSLTNRRHRRVIGFRIGRSLP
jgi:hypothetical protein